jgi:plasmid stabilization system protein ParE
MNGYDFHPEAAIDLDEIWDFIAEKNLDAADKVIATILAMNWCHFRIKASSPDLP